MADASTINHVHAGPVRRIQDALRGFAAGYQKYRLYRSTINDLQGLSNRELADLGLHRTEIRRVAYHAAYE
ncbi:MAG: DUF1127 domain-containing protein [Rhodobacteraceae bacterium]|nr:MAG: DUF1127 domain-containing protein [Paracoccaceae bacterium]